MKHLPTPITQLADRPLLLRLQGLAKSHFFMDGKPLFPTELRSIYDETWNEANVRGILPKPFLEVSSLIQAGDASPTFHNGTLVRYASPKRLAAFSNGEVTFTNAGYYETIEHAAQRDFERERHWYVPDRVLKINGVSYPAKDMVLRQSLGTIDGDSVRYFMLCLSTEESPKLQRCFSSDKAEAHYVIIQNLEAFFTTLETAAKSQFPDSTIASKTIWYYDPLWESGFTKTSKLVFSKVIDFVYQREVRVALFSQSLAGERINLRVEWPPGVISGIRSFF